MSKRPNIVIVNPDQMRWDYMTPAGHPFIDTRHLSALAAKGTHYRKTFCVSPMCGPSRTSFVTGQYPMEHGVRNYHGELDPAKPHAFRQFKKAGYRIALHGKDHIVYDDAIGILYDEGEDICLGNSDDHPDYQHSWSSGPLEKGSEWDITERLATAGLSFMERQAAANTPFLLTLNFQDPHPYFACPEPYASLFSPDQFELPPNFRREPVPGEPTRLSIWREHSESLLATEEDFKKAMAMYGGQIRYVDDQLGRVMAKLDELGIADNTLVLFWSDHGELLGDFGVTHKLPCYYDCLTRVPAILYDPSGRIAPGDCDELVETIDLMATLLDLAGLEQPPGSGARSLLEPVSPPREDVFSEAGLYVKPPAKPTLGLKLRAPLEPTHWGPGCMLRTDIWKLCRYAHDQGELYDLANDPYEMNNLYGLPDYATMQANLETRLTRRLLCQGQAPELLPDAPRE